MRRARDIEIPSAEADELVRLAIEGGADAFAVLFRITYDRVYRFLYGRCGEASLAEDLTQDAYIRAIRAIRTSFQGGSSDFLSWVMRIARNLFLDHVKSGKVKWEFAVDSIPVTVSTLDPEADVLATIEASDLRRALSRLTDEQQEVVYLRFLQGLSISEVAVVTGRTEGAVKGLQFRALRSLARLIGAESHTLLGRGDDDDAG